MEELTLRETMNRAHEIHEQGRKWHFHLFTPTCLFNPQKNKYLLVVESDQDVFGFYADHSCMEQDKELVELLHGKDITRGEGPAEDNENIQKNSGSG